MTAIRYHHTVNDLQRATPGLRWDSDGPFAGPDWFSLLEAAETRPLLASAQHGTMAIALPLRETGTGLEALTNWYAFTWSALHTAGCADPALLDGLARDLARDLARRATRVDLAKLPEEDGTMERLRRAFRAAGWMVLAQPCDTNHVLPVNGRTYAHYLADRPGPLRTTLKRKAKKVQVTLADRFAAEDWCEYEAIYAESWKPEEGNPALLRRFAERESAAGRYRFGLARHQGVAVAAQFWTVEGSTAYIHKLAHRESARPLSAGTTLTAALFERVIDIDKVALVDFGTGDDPYKRDWMEQVRTRWRLICLRPQSPRNWPLLGKTAARGLLHKLVSPARQG